MVPRSVVPSSEAVGANWRLWSRCLGVQGSRAGPAPWLWLALQAFKAPEGQSFSTASN